MSWFELLPGEKPMTNQEYEAMQDGRRAEGLLSLDDSHYLRLVWFPQLAEKGRRGNV